MKTNRKLRFYCVNCCSITVNTKKDNSYRHPISNDIKQKWQRFYWRLDCPHSFLKKMHRKFEGNRPIRKKVMLFQRMDWNAIHDLPFSQAGRKTLAYNCQQLEDQNLDLFCCFKFVSSFCKFLPPVIPHFTISLFIHTMASPFVVINSCQYYVTNCRIVTQTAMFLLPLDAVQKVLSNAHRHFANKLILRLI